MKPFYSILISVLFLTIIVLSVVQIVVSNRLSSTGLILSSMQEEIANYKRDNTSLSEKLLEETSLTHIASRAATLGFVETKAQVYIQPAHPVALNR